MSEKPVEGASEKGADKLTVEQIASLDQELKGIEGAAPLWSLDRLFFGPDDREAIGKLKASAQTLTKAKELFGEGQRELWEKSLGKQVRHSVDRAKKMAGKG